ncbi:MAG TPA: thiolase family protein, partial [Polyangiaceae bacterium]|nr:thiolase family protein [Polyangiaceae bacterium]
TSDRLYTVVMSSSVYLVSLARTPIGAFLGALAPLTAPQLGAVAIGAAVRRAGVEPGQVDEVWMGNVLSAGLGQAPARQAAIGAQLPSHVPCTTVSKVCGSGLAAIVLGCRSIQLGEADIVVSGGMESMSNTPYYLPRARSGLRMGHAELQDGMILDGLWDPYNDFHMGRAGELCARRYELGREQQDAFAAESYSRALLAQKNGWFDAEIESVEVPQRKGTPLVVKQDEEPARGNVARLGELKPAFEKDGSITAGNASSVNDGAAAVVLASGRAVEKLGLRPLARVLGHASFAQDPAWFSTAPVGASRRALERVGLAASAIDLWEINEAFACVTLACARDLGASLERVNVHGGAVALGHPIGASGARIVCTLISALGQRGLRRGLATLCIGGGEALALVVER